MRGRVFARVMVAGRDARLSGAELRVLLSIALHLQHLGRSKGMMTLASLADDAMVTQRTVRNALRTLQAMSFVRARIRTDGQLELLLDRRFQQKAPVPAGAGVVDKSPRRSAARKKISRNPPRLVSHTLPLRKSYSPPERRNIPRQTARREFPGASRPDPTATATEADCEMCYEHGGLGCIDHPRELGPPSPS